MTEERQRRQVIEMPQDRDVPAPGALGHYRPRRMQDGRWRYTMRTVRPGDGRQRWYAVGYCMDQCDGHDTGDAARQHFRLYLIEKQTKLNLPRGDGQHWERCRICKAQEMWWLELVYWLATHGFSWPAKKLGGATLRWAVVAGGAFSYPLCTKHQQRWYVDELLPVDIGEMIG